MTPEERAMQIGDLYDNGNGWLQSGLTVLVLNDRVAQAITEAIEAERQAILAAAMEVESQSATLMKKSPGGSHDQQFYRGRGLGAAVIIKKIWERMKGEVK